MPGLNDYSQIIFSLAMVNLTPYQRQFIKSVREKFTPNRNYETIKFDPPRPYMDLLKPVNVTDYYLKPIIAAVPHQQFSGLKLLCPHCQEGELAQKGWAHNPEARFVHSLEGGKYAYLI